MNPQKKMVYMQKLFNPSQFSRSPANSLRSLSKENFDRVMVESINKAINTTEAPVKTKHVRLLLIGSHQIQNSEFFWRGIPIVRLKENQIACWKFCHVLHMMLKDGHPHIVGMSFEYRQTTLLDCGNMWRHIDGGYGQLIYKYCTLLYNRVNFLMRNYPNYISTDLSFRDSQLNQIHEYDSETYFSLSCEVFDAIDDILQLQELVLTRVETKRLSSMSAAGQCHLSPLVTLIQDSSLLYDYSVHILFRLHASLRGGDLEGHRSRFLMQHNALKKFYANTSSLQYFKTLIQVPHLTEKPPNFLVASDLEQHVAPVVLMISNQERDSPDQVLVNLGDDDESSTYENPDYSLTISEQQRPGTSNSMLDSQQDNGRQTKSPDPFGSHPNDESDHWQVDNKREPNSTTVSDEMHQIDTGQVQELEMMVAKLRSELDAEQTKHQDTRRGLQSIIDQSQEERKKVRDELSNLKHHVISCKKAYDVLDEECKRAKHDNEISQVAMKKMVKEMSELRGQQRQDRKLADAVAQREADVREEDLLVAEMNETDKIIKEATRKIEMLGEKSRKVETGIKLEVNEKILEVCTNLMKAVRNLIAQSRLLQREIVNSEVGQLNKDEFYKRNSDWTDGLISAANVVAVATRSLVEAADRSMSGKSKNFCELAAAAQSITAAISQLVIASKVKANKDSEKLKLLMNAAKQVNQCTSNVVEASRVCAELIDQQEVDKIDIGSLSLHQTKKLEMETQVRLLELEDELSKQRSRLGLLRRKHYEEEEAQSNESKA